MIVEFSNSLSQDVGRYITVPEHESEHQRNARFVVCTTYLQVLTIVLCTTPRASLVDVADSKLENRPIASCYPTPRDKKATRI